MDKIIEMTSDGRLSIVWVAISFLLLAAVWECVSLVRRRNRRVSGSQRLRKY
jgi:hypothetical protein